MAAIYWMDKLMPAFISAGVALMILALNRRWERRKLSLELYKEFYSETVADGRYKAELFFERYAHVEWANGVDPYDLLDSDDQRRGYAAVTRYWARLSILYREQELQRALTARLMSQMAGYWWGLVYEKMTCRENMYTRDDLIFLFGELKRRSAKRAFEKGYRSGVGRRDRQAGSLRAAGVS